MKLGIMQPYFFPYIGYFHLMNSVDRWIVFDIVNYKKKSWMNRNRILSADKGWQYISYPVEKTSIGTKICDVLGKDAVSAQERIVAQFDAYKKRAPHLEQTLEVIEETFARRRSDRLVDICVSGLQVVCERLDIDLELEIISEMELDLPDIDHAGGWALEISKALGADTYINPIGGQGIFRPEDFRSAGIELVFSDPAPLTYDVKPFEFEPSLSVLDVVSWLSMDDTRSWLQGALNDG